MALRIEELQDADLFRERVAAAVGTRFGELPTLSAPLPVETADPAAIGAGQIRPTSAERPPRWQCLIGREEPEAVVEVVRDADDYVVVSINTGDLAPSLNDAVLSAESLGDIEDFELRELEIPGLHFAAIHLIGRTKVLFIPVVSTEHRMAGIEPLTPMTGAELGAALRPHAYRIADEIVQ